MADTVLFTDTFTGSNGAAWSGTNWGISGSASTAASIQSNTGQLSVPTTANANIKAWGYTTDLLTAEILVKVKKAASTSTTKIYVSPANDFVSGGTGEFVHTNGVWAEFTNAANSVITLKAARGGTVTTGPTLTPTWALNTQMNMRVRRDGNTVYLRVWAIGASEPGTWDVTWNAGTTALPTVTTNVRPFLGLHNGTSSTTATAIQFDDVTASSVTPVFDGGYSAQASTASTLAVEPFAYGAYKAAITADGDLTATPTWTGTASSVVWATNRQAFFTFDMSGIAANSSFSAATLWVYVTGNGGITTARTIVARTAKSAWTEASGPSYQTASGASDTTVTGTLNTGEWVAIDIKNTLQELVNGSSTNGFYLLNTGITGSVTANSRESASNKPYITATFSPVTNYSDPETPATASADVVAPVISTTRVVTAGAVFDPATATMVNPSVVVTAVIPVTVSASALTASADVVGPAVATTVSIPASVTAPVSTASATAVDATASGQTNPDVSYTADVATANATAPTAVFSSSELFSASPSTATAEAVNASVSTETNAVIHPTTMFSLATLIPPAEAQGSTADPYYLRVASQTRESDMWYRFDESSGTVAQSEIPNLFGASSAYTAQNGVYVGTPGFGGIGPEGRKVIHFSGDDYVKFGDSDVLATMGTMEFTIRTTKANQVIVNGIDSGSFDASGFPRQTLTNIDEISLLNGRLRVRTGVITMADTADSDFSGGKAINDGEWHHIVVTWNGGHLRVLADGVLQFQRRLEGSAFVAIPDTFGGGASTRQSGPDYPQGYDASRMFVGDAMEFVFHQYALDETQAIRNFYAVFGIVPVYAEASSASATMSNAKGKGNRKRALALFYDETQDPNMTDFDYQNEYNWVGLRTVGDLTLSHYGSIPFELREYICFPKSVLRDEKKSPGSYLGGAYFDEVTGEPRYIDISTEVPDIEDYDLIFFMNLPPLRGDSRAGYTFTEQVGFQKLYEDMVAGVRRVVDKGVSLWVPQPDLAVALGVCDTYEVHTMGRENATRNDVGNAISLYDWRAANVDPWKLGAYQGGSIDEGAYYYYDTHALNRYRITANVPGFTDLGGWRIKDYTFGRPRDIFRPPFESWDYEEIPDGLAIGMTEYYNQDFYNASNTSNGDYNHRRTVVSIPPSAIRAGTVVAREIDKHWVAKSEVDNPWKDNAVIVCVNPGDSLKGAPVGGKIFVSFMADASDPLGMLPRQLVTMNPDETVESLAWDYSSARTTLTAQGVGGGVTIYTELQAALAALAGTSQVADLQMLQTLLSGSNGSVVQVNEYQAWPVTFVRRFTVIDRALNWLGQRTVIAPGDAVIRVGASEATASVSSPVVVAQRDTHYTATAAIGLAQMAAPVGFAGPSVEIRVLPMDAAAVMTGYGKTFSASAATAHAELVESFDMIHTSGEQAVLILHYADATLFIKEDA